MESINVVLTTSIGEECMRQITAISPKIKLWDISPKTKKWDSSEWSNLVRNGYFTSKKQFDMVLAKAEVISGFGPPDDVVSRAPKLKWIHCMLAGVDHFIDDAIARSPVIVTNARGVHAVPVSEFALQLLLMFTKKAPFCFQLKQSKQWGQFSTELLHSKTVGVVGLGGIGQEIARLAKAFRMKVIALDVKRKVRTKNVDVMLPLERLRELLSESDFVVLALPLTPETRKLIGEAELRAMKPTAYLINIARGATVDEDALIRALDEHWIAGAGLDAFSAEPLPSDSKLWELPNVIFSPHVAGVIENANVIATQLFSENLKRYLSGKKLLNIVNKKKGY